MIYMMLSTGFEEIEAVGVIDILRRAGVEVTTVSAAGGKVIIGAHNIPVIADIYAESIDFKKAEGVILPGGLIGVRHLQQSAYVKQLVSHCAENGKLIAAICAAPSILASWGLLHGVKSTCHPSVEEQLSMATLLHHDVVVDGNIITSRGAGTTHHFAFEIVKQIMGTAVSAELARTMMYE